MPNGKNIVFDVVGTLVCYDRIVHAVDTRLGDRLREIHVNPYHFVNTWIEIAEREYTYLSISKNYIPFDVCFEQLFHRTLWMAGIKDPATFATKDDLSHIMSEYERLDMRPGASECVAKLRKAGFTVWALTAGDRTRVGKYFVQAGIEMPEENLLSCDMHGVGKPEPLAYKPLLERLLEEGGSPWFAAAHAWDSSAARRVGFKAAYCTVLEGEPVPGLFGEMHVTAETLPEMADKIIANEMYWLAVQNRTLAPDGYERQVLVFNGTYPGPLIEADWGDTVIIHVTNQLTDNGTAIHWHGIRQHGTNQFDGVPGVTQCPIAPGDTMTYKFCLTQYGTSWYHAHWSLQLADGLYGPIKINGPATADYDIDLGPVFITEWFHESAFVKWVENTMYGGLPVRPNAVAENGLINGTNNFPCGDTDDPACKGTGKRSEVVFQKGKKYRLRIIDAQVDGWMKFTIDGHKLTVIAADFVPIVPYETESILMTSGQRYDVIVEANQDGGNFWMRSIYQTACNILSIDRNEIWGIVRYEGAPATDPTTEKWDSVTNSCGDEPYDKLVPHVGKNVGEVVDMEHFNLGWFYETDLVFHWTINKDAFVLDWANPTNLMVYQNKTEFPDNYGVFEIPADKKWTYWVIQDFTVVNAYHPFHLHGHDFFILAQGRGIYNKLTVELNRVNPPRRDTATMDGSGYIVIAFENDNPGAWLMHCHIAWHASQSMAVQFVERPSEITPLIDTISDEFDSMCANWDEYYKTSLYKQDDSGI
ncbi:multicopper oxidase-domain-containing protein [Aspergillus ambiguus]|uniref:multicopper oxidase-domain-containing protein n=1 Tax=Aspergillus ambiguus TaxID=176160 RepID=UPI003CCE387E